MTKRKKIKSNDSELKKTQKALHECLTLLAEAYQRYGADACPGFEEKPWITIKKWEKFMDKLVKIQKLDKYIPDEMFD
jgi:hypothetical protein